MCRKNSLFLESTERLGTISVYVTVYIIRNLAITVIERASKWLFNPLVVELYLYSLAHHLCKMLIFYEPRRVTLGNTQHFVEE